MRVRFPCMQDAKVVHVAPSRPKPAHAQVLFGLALGFIRANLLIITID